MTRYLTKPTNARELIGILEEIEKNIQKPRREEKQEMKVTNLFVQKAMDYISMNYSQKLTLTKISEQLCITPNYLSELFKKHTGQNVSEYIIDYRLEKACQFLKNPQLRIGEVSEKVGINDVRYFSSMFKKKYNLTPRELQKKLLETTYVYPSPISPCHIVESETIPVLFLSYIGNYETYSTVNFETYTWDYLYEYAKENFLLPDKEDYWGIAYDDTDITSSEKCRFYACMTIQKEAGFNPSLTSPIKYMELPQSTYAVYTHQGDYVLLDVFLLRQY